MAEEIQSENRTARYTVKVGSVESTQAAPNGLEYLFVEDHVDMIGVAELTYSGGSETSWSSFNFGDKVTITMGGSDKPVFDGVIAKLRMGFKKGRDTLTVVAMDPLVYLANSRKTRVWEESKDSDAVSAVIGESKADAGTVDATSTKHAYIFQRNESDLQFCRRMAARNGFLLTSKEGKVEFKKPQYGSAVELPKDRLISLEYTTSPGALPKDLTALSWDYRKKEKVEHKQSTITKVGDGSGDLGKDGVLWQGSTFISDVWMNETGALSAFAEAEFNRLSRATLRGRAVVQGDGSISAGTMIKFSGHQDGYNAGGFVVSSRHRVYIGGGFETEFLFVGNQKPA